MLSEIETRRESKGQESNLLYPKTLSEYSESKDQEKKLYRGLKVLGSLLTSLKMIKFEDIAESSNGRTADSGSAYWGSNPCSAAQSLASNCS